MQEAAAPSQDPPGTPGPGEPPPAHDVPPPGTGPLPPPPRREPLLQVLAGLWRELPGLLEDRLELLGLELQRAGMALVQIVVLIVVVAILGVTAWLVLWVGVIAALVGLGLHLALALAVALLLNGVAAALAVARVRRLLPLLRLPATRRHLRFSPSPEPPPTDEHAANRPAAGHPVAP